MTDEEQWHDDLPAPESGPFCRHYGDPGDCDETCARCGHECRYHSYELPCSEPGCECEEWHEH